MIGLLPILARWRLGLGIAGALALLGLIGALSHYRHAYHAEQALRAADRASYAQAQAEASRRAQEALQRQEYIYVTKARETDNVYVAKIADARSLADAYISRMRVKAPSRDASGTPASAQGSGAGLPETMPADSFVAINQSDLQACTVDAVTANGAFHWALSLAK